MYEKLIRDKIADYVLQKGESIRTRIAGPEEYYRFLQEKLLEEAEEFAANPSPEELADLLQVVHTIMTYHQWDPAAIERLRVEKEQAKGGLEGRIILIQD
jgi:predicted house-cleaning noncanonical NTP pyrophosphatase (MazG superfamily)